MVPLFGSATEAAGRPVTTLCAILDMAGMTMKTSSSGACYGSRL